MKVLHLVRRPRDAYAIDMMAAQQKASHDLSVVFLQDGVYCPEAPTGTRYVVEEDCVARGVEAGAEAITHERLVDLIFESDRVISW